MHSSLCVVYRNLCPEAGGFMDTRCLHGCCQTQMGAEPLPCKQQGALVMRGPGESRVVPRLETAGRAPVGSCLQTSLHHHKAALPLLWGNRSESGCSVPKDSR